MSFARHRDWLTRFGEEMSNISSMCTFSLNTRMVSDRTAAVICNRCAVFHFLPETRRDSCCVSCNVVAVLEEKIHSLEGQILTLGDIRNAEELGTNRREKTTKKPNKQKSRRVL